MISLPLCWSCTGLRTPMVHQQRTSVDFTKCSASSLRAWFSSPPRKVAPSGGHRNVSICRTSATSSEGVLEESPIRGEDEAVVEPLTQLLKAKGRRGSPHTPLPPVNSAAVAIPFLHSQNNFWNQFLSNSIECITTIFHRKWMVFTVIVFPVLRIFCQFFSWNEHCFDPLRFGSNQIFGVNCRSVN